METFQECLYGRGEDLLSRPVQHALAARWNVSAADFDQALAHPATREEAGMEAKEAAALMGDLSLYPTLFLEQDAERTLLARGYAPVCHCEKCADSRLGGHNSQGGAGRGLRPGRPGL